MAAWAFVTLLASCAAVGPDFVAPADALRAVALTPAEGADGLRARPLAAPVPAAWWALFGDAALTALQARAVDANLDLQTAAARIEQSRAQLGIARAAPLPKVNLNVAADREANSPSGKQAALGAPTTPHNFYQAGLQASWEIDFWGRARRAGERAEALLQVDLYDREAVRIALAAQVAQTYLQLRGMQARLALAQHNVDVAQRLLQMAESRLRNGVAMRFETASQRAQLASVSARVPDLVRQRDAQLNALALLLALPPRQLDAELLPAMPPPALPEQIPVGLSSDLARRRPDILRAEASLHAATASIGIAKADFYPTISLTGQGGVEAFHR